MDSESSADTRSGEHGLSEGDWSFPSDLFAKSVTSISAAYSTLGHTLGWRFLAGPQSTLSPATDIGFITLNPGGDQEPADHLAPAAKLEVVTLPKLGRAIQKGRRRCSGRCSRYLAHWHVILEPTSVSKIS